MAIGAQPLRQDAGAQEVRPLRMATLSMLADSDYLPLARTTAMHVGALLAFPIARVNDLRLAVNEACVCFLDTAARREPEGFGMWPAPESMEIVYDRYPDELHVTVRAAAGENLRAVNELGWAMLEALVGDVQVRVGDGVGAVTLILPLPTGEGG